MSLTLNWMRWRTMHDYADMGTGRKRERHRNWLKLIVFFCYIISIQSISQIETIHLLQWLQSVHQNCVCYYCLLFQVAALLFWWLHEIQYLFRTIIHHQNISTRRDHFKNLHHILDQYQPQFKQTPKSRKWNLDRSLHLARQVSNWTFLDLFTVLLQLVQVFCGMQP